MISLVDLTAVLQRAWMEAAGEQVPTQFPGVPLDATRLAAWFEFWITQVEQPLQRVPGTEVRMVLLDIHCFSRRPEKRQVMAMADRVCTVFAHQAFPLSPDGAALLSGGAIRLREAAVRDLTRETGHEPKLPIQHLVVSLTGRAEKPPEASSPQP